MESMKRKSARLLEEYVVARAHELGISLKDMPTATLHVALNAKGVERILLESLIALNAYVAQLEQALADDGTPFDQKLRHVHEDIEWDTGELDEHVAGTPSVGEYAQFIGRFDMIGIVVGVNPFEKKCKIYWIPALGSKGETVRALKKQFVSKEDNDKALALAVPHNFADMEWHDGSLDAVQGWLVEDLDVEHEPAAKGPEEKSK